MTDQSEAGHLDRQEIIIVRRRAGERRGAHHGGVWKIAFADFMTAMMAFFLVMWLTNSSDMATRKQVAQYFNPIKLNDPRRRPAARARTTAPRATEKQNGESKAETNGDPHGKPLAGDQKGGEEQALFRDPYAVLAEIAAQSASTTGGEEQGKPDGTGPARPQRRRRLSRSLRSLVLAARAERHRNRRQQDAAPPSEFKTAVLSAEATASRRPGKPADLATRPRRGR